MKFSLSWLKQHLDTDADINAIADCLNRIGLEVEGIENPADALADFRIAKVLSAAPHPQADKLQVLSVDAGVGNPLQVVCGAPNARAGMLGVFGPAGATVPSSGMLLKIAEIRGVQSNGMMCSEMELGAGEDHDGIIDLPTDAPLGQAYADYAGLNDPVLDIAITPNRQDCMGVRGIARDLAAAGLGKLKDVKAVYHMPDSGIIGSGAGPDIAIEDTDGCPAFYGIEISGVANGAAPAWMVKHLASAGQKPISALVDITNFVMLDLGRPLHVYDKAKLSGGLVARKAKPGEEVLALNGKAYTLDATMTVIADDVRVHDIGGIMGGADSGCSNETKDVIIECAYFTPDSIARTGQKLMLTSDARQRFERGVDPAFLDDGLRIATWLVTEHCGGIPSGVTRAGNPNTAPRHIAFEPSHTLALGGVDVPADMQKAILESIGFNVDPDWNVAVPSWRRDAEGSADLVEEIVRMVGLDNVPPVPLPRAEGVAKPTATAAQRIERKVRRTAAARGLNEAINWAFLPEKEADAFGGGDWTLANPISADMKVMRPSLLPGLLCAAARNLDRGADSVRLFEIGRRYFKAADGSSDERLTLGLVLAGDKTQRNWAGGKAAKFDAYDAKAEVIAVLSAAGVATDNLRVMGFEDFGQGGHYHPGQSATLRMGPKNILAAFGTLHPATAKVFDLEGSIITAEVFLHAIPEKKAQAGFMRPNYAPPALQPVSRDFAFLVADTLPAHDLVRTVKGCDKANIQSVRIFDRFAGQGVPEGQISIAVEVMLQPTGKSYSDEDLKSISETIIGAAKKCGATLRG